MDSAPPNLPYDVIFETLSRILSLKTLDTCKVVCKDWNQLVSEPSFMPEYCKNTKNLYGFYVQDQKSCKYKQEFVSLEPSCQSDKDLTSITVGKKFWENGTKIEASSKQGILCVVKWKSRFCRYYICKPSTGQWQPLPNPKLRFRTVKVALAVLHSNPLRYKIVRISQDYGSSATGPDFYAYCCEIFDSKTWTWRRANDIVLPYGVFFDHRNHAVHAGGLIYWLTTDGHVVAFNHEDEMYLRFPLPRLEGNYSSNQLIEYEGKLGLVRKAGEENIMELWVVDDSKNHRWRLIQEVRFDPALERDYAIPGGFYSRDIAVLNACDKMVFYKVQDSSVKEVELGSTGSHSPKEIFPFRSDLEPVNLRPVNLRG